MGMSDLPPRLMVGGGLSLVDVLSDIRYEPAWRHTANREWAYADCNQFDSDILQAMEAAGMLPVSRPLIPAALDIVLGMEARTRRDGVVSADEEKDSDVAKALSVRLHEAERLSGLDQAISAAYAGQVFVGVGWVEVGKNPDPLGYRHLCGDVGRAEVYWDYRAGLGQRVAKQSQWRYMVRMAWFDLDQLQLMFPGQETLLAGVGARSAPDWATQALLGGRSTRDDAEQLFREAGYLDLERTSGMVEQEWLDTERARVCLYEVWYRVYERVDLLRIPAERLGEGQEEDLLLELSQADPRHLEMLAAGMAEIESAVIGRVRLSYWAGPHRLADIPSPYRHGAFPYVMFPGIREDRTGMYYGLIRRMLSTQDAINADLTMSRHLSTSTMVVADSDAFADPDPDRVRSELANRRSLILLNPKRQNRNQKPEIRTDRELSAQHHGMMAEAMRTMPELAGIYAALQGKSTPQQSGVAVAALVEQGTTGLAALNANYANARKESLRLLLANEIQYMGRRRFSVTIEKARQKVRVYFNRPWLNEDGSQQGLSNDLTILSTRVELADAPASATFKQQLLQQLMEMAKALPGEAQIVLIPAIIRGMDFPDREEIASAFEQRMGIGQDQDPAALLNRQRKEALDRQRQQLELDAGQAKVAVESAKADKLSVEIEQLRMLVTELAQRIHATGQDQAIRSALAGQLIPPAPADAATLLPQMQQ